jgi:aryl-alcohol dehydrogenase-like predicted oxidoreductase
MSRMGLGCMRFVSHDDARATIAAAAEAGIVWFDTARAYGNEAVVGSALLGRGRVITKCGMKREGWEPDGRAMTITADARASAEALGRAPDLLLLHAPDPRVSLETSVRALLRARSEGLARGIGLSNVTRKDLDRVGESIDAVQVALGAFDDGAARGGVVAWCKERGVPLFAHSPLGGPVRSKRLAKDRALRAIAERHAGATPEEIVLAYLLAVSEVIVPLPGARRPETARSAARAAGIVLDERDLAELDARFPGLGIARVPPRAARASPGAPEVVMLMGIPGAGKSRLAQSYVASGHVRLNRDTLGGTLRGIARRLEALLADPANRRIVLDNTYVSRSSRSEVIRVAQQAGASVTCIVIDVPLAQAQVNVTWRMLEKHGELLGGEALAARAKVDDNLFSPTTLLRMMRQLEIPAVDEGFTEIRTVPFVRDDVPGVPGAAIPLDLVLADRHGKPTLVTGAEDALRLVPEEVPLLIFGWRPDLTEAWRDEATALLPRPAEILLCAHAAGPPVCWCRPPLPGLWLAFARQRGIASTSSVFVVRTAAHQAMAAAVGARAIVQGPR